MTQELLGFPCAAKSLIKRSKCEKEISLLFCSPSLSLSLSHSRPAPSQVQKIMATARQRSSGYCPYGGNNTNCCGCIFLLLLLLLSCFLLLLLLLLFFGFCPFLCRAFAIHFAQSQRCFWIPLLFFCISLVSRFYFGIWPTFLTNYEYYSCSNEVRKPSTRGLSDNLASSHSPSECRVQCQMQIPSWIFNSYSYSS